MIHDFRIQDCELIKGSFLPGKTIQGFHLLYIFSGDGILIVDSSSYPCHEDEIFLFSSADIVIPQYRPDSSLSVFYIFFTVNSYNLIKEIQNLPSRLPAESRFRPLILELLHEYTMKHQVYLDVCSYYLNQLLFPCVVRRKRQLEPVPVHTHITEPDATLCLACNYIEQHLSDDLDTAALCRITHLNAKHLNQRFRSSYQMSLTEYIGSRRLAKARELLHFSDYSITQIAEISGFKSIHYFSFIFKKKTGISPSEYRSVQYINP